MRFLDYRKVKDAERTKAKELFGTVEEPSALASKVGLPYNITASGTVPNSIYRSWALNRGHLTCHQRMVSQRIWARKITA